MSKNKFQRVLNPREQAEINKQLAKADVELSPDMENFKEKFATKAPIREDAPVEERRMSFEEYRRLGVPAQYRGFYFSGR